MKIEQNNILNKIENGDINILWNGWFFSGGRDYGNWHEYDMFLSSTGEEYGYLRFYDDGKTVEILIGNDIEDTELYKKADNILNKALARDDKAILVACGDEAGNIYLPSDYGDISREDVIKSLSYTVEAPYDTVTVTKYGYDDFDIYLHNGDCSLKGTAEDVLKELTLNNLDKVKAFADENFSKDSKDQLTVENELYGIAVSTPWIDTSARFPLNDADAFFNWDVKTVVDFCIKVMEKIK